MSGLAIVVMVGIFLFVWGGFLGFLIRAARHESRKQRAEEGR